MRAVHIIVPAGIDDPARPSGGNRYDRRVCDGLTALGWSVREHAVPGAWPNPDPAAYTSLTGVLAGVPDGALLLVDGLIASTARSVLVPAAGRLRLIVLVHMPLGDASTGETVRRDERAVLSAAAAIIATGHWTRQRLVEAYALDPDRIHVAEPGVDAAAIAAGTSAGRNLLCVAAVTPQKGHDVLLAALATIAEMPWRCVCAGSLERDPAFVDALRRQARAYGVADRLTFTGPLVGQDLDHAYAAADALVLASRGETYGMVVTEALARGLPVIATAVGGLPAALGHASDRTTRPGLLVPAGDPAALGSALRGWLDDATLRRRLRDAAAQRRGTLSGWPVTTDLVARSLLAAAERVPA